MTARSRRTVVVSPALVELLAAYIPERPKTRSNVLFLNLEGRPFTLGGFESSWHKVRERAAAIMRRDAAEMKDRPPNTPATSSQRPASTTCAMQETAAAAIEPMLRGLLPEMPAR